MRVGGFLPQTENTKPRRRDEVSRKLNTRRRRLRTEEVCGWQRSPSHVMHTRSERLSRIVRTPSPWTSKSELRSSTIHSQAKSWLKVWIFMFTSYNYCEFGWFSIWVFFILWIVVNFDWFMGAFWCNLCSGVTLVLSFYCLIIWVFLKFNFLCSLCCIFLIYHLIFDIISLLLCVWAVLYCYHLIGNVLACEHTLSTVYLDWGLQHTLEFASMIQMEWV